MILPSLIIGVIVFAILVFFFNFNIKIKVRRSYENKFYTYYTFFLIKIELSF